MNSCLQKDRLPVGGTDNYCHLPHARRFYIDLWKVSDHSCHIQRVLSKCFCSCISDSTMILLDSATHSVPRMKSHFTSYHCMQARTIRASPSQADPLLTVAAVLAGWQRIKGLILGHYHLQHIKGSCCHQSLFSGIYSFHCLPVASVSCQLLVSSERHEGRVLRGGRGRGLSVLQSRGLTRRPAWNTVLEAWGVALIFCLKSYLFSTTYSQYLLFTYSLIASIYYSLQHKTWTILSILFSFLVSLSVNVQPNVIIILGTRRTAWMQQPCDE